MRYVRGIMHKCANERDECEIERWFYTCKEIAILVDCFLMHFLPREYELIDKVMR